MMKGQNGDIDHLKANVNCATILERLPPVWRLDARESTRRSLKYRRGDGEILIVNHDGRGWWDPMSDAKGDVFTLVRHLDPALDFRAACRLLHTFAGIAPDYPKFSPPPAESAPAGAMSERWVVRPLLTHGSTVWLYLTRERALPASVLTAARAADAVREGPHGSAWFAHRGAAREVTGIEMRGPDWRGFSSGGVKTIFGLPGGTGPLPRLTVCESAIDALSLAALENTRRDTLYLATAGGMGPATLVALRQLLEPLSANPDGILVAATDADGPGRRHAARLAACAAGAGVRFERLLPPHGLNDWNDVLRALTPTP